MNNVKKLEWMLDWLVMNHATNVDDCQYCPFTCGKFVSAERCPVWNQNHENDDLLRDWSDGTMELSDEEWREHFFDGVLYAGGIDGVPCDRKDPVSCWKAAAEWAYEHRKEK